MRTFGNILWFIFGGLLLSLMWGIIGVICSCTIIAIPIGVQCFKFASFVFWPFGRDVVFQAKLNQNSLLVRKMFPFLVFSCGRMYMIHSDDSFSDC